MEIVKVESKSFAYDILVDVDLLQADAVSERLNDLVSKRSCLIVTDSNVKPLYQNLLVSLLQKANAGYIASSCIEAGECSKNLKSVERLYHFAVEQGLGRDSVVFALGGGVTGDLAGFFAATYMRGVPFVQIPTSLLAQVDSSVGGKVGVDLPEGKNLVGAFLQPQLVIADIACLRTLPQREIRCGLAEIVKYGMIMDGDFFSRLEASKPALSKLDLSVYNQTVSHCCRLKAEVVSEDEREQGRRAILNYGHTFGHALEQLGNYELLNHGEAVSIGMAMAADLAVNLGYFERELAERQNHLLKELGLPVFYKGKVAPDLVWKAMQRDKKMQAGQLRLVVPVKIGSVEIISVSDAAVVQKAIGGRVG